MLADFQEARDRAVPPHVRGGSCDMAAWADMLSMIGRKNSQLYDLLGHEPAGPRVSRPGGTGRTIVRELERERSRIARELHAGAGQPLAGIKLNLEMLDDCAAALPLAGRQALVRLQALTEQAIEQVRAVSHSLHPPEWQHLTTGEALGYLMQSSGLAVRLAVDADIAELPVEPSHTVKIVLYRCAQECISNVVRHSGATHFRLCLTPLGKMVELLMEDNGRGFPEPTAGGKGIGLLAIREHAVALGGDCDISGNAGGVRIRVRLPVAVD